MFVFGDAHSYVKKCYKSDKSLTKNTSTLYEISIYR